MNGPFNQIQVGAMGGFSLVQISAGLVGSGIRLNGVTKLNIDNIYISGFNVGILATDVIDFHLSNSTFYTETFHVEGVSTGLTRPNAWNLSDNIFVFAADAAVFLVHPAMVNILNNNFEGSTAPI